MTFSPDSMYYYFDAVTQDAEELQMYPECIIIHNITGVYNLINAIEYENALHHFYEAIDCAEKSGSTDAYYMLLINVSIIHYISRILPPGHCREICDYGRRTGDSYFMYTGALMYAYMYHSWEMTRRLSGISGSGAVAGAFGRLQLYEPLYASVLASLGRNR